MLERSVQAQEGIELKELLHKTNKRSSGADEGPDPDLAHFEQRSSKKLLELHANANEHHDPGEIVVGVVHSLRRWKRVLAKAYEQSDVIEEEENEEEAPTGVDNNVPFSKRTSTTNLIHQPTYYNLNTNNNPASNRGNPGSPHDDPSKSKLERFSTQYHGPNASAQTPKVTPKQKLRAAGHVLMGIQKQKPGLQMPDSRLGKLGI